MQAKEPKGEGMTEMKKGGEGIRTFLNYNAGRRDAARRRTAGVLNREGQHVQKNAEVVSFVVGVDPY